MIAYNWADISFDCKIEEDGLQNVIEIIHWRYVGTDGDISVDLYGAQVVPNPNPDNFTPYEEVSSEMVASWLEEILDIKSLQENIAKQIQEKKNPTRVTLPLYENKI